MEYTAEFYMHMKHKSDLSMILFSSKTKSKSQSTSRYTWHYTTQQEFTLCIFVSCKYAPPNIFHVAIPYHFRKLPLHTKLNYVQYTNVCSLFQGHFLSTLDFPCSSYSCLEIHICWNDPCKTIQSHKCHSQLTTSLISYDYYYIIMCVQFKLL